MSKHYIKSISIEGFRGINNKNDPLKLDFKVNGITSIFSPNGMGKSSIFDALSFCLNDELKCLKPLVHENKDYKSIQNIFHSGDGLITIVLQDEKKNENTIKFKIDNNGKKEIISPNKTDIEAIIENIKDIHNFLDYNAFADIIYSNQEDAGKTFLKLIGYESFSVIQDKLTKLTRTQNLTNDYKIQAKKDELNDNNEIISLSKETIFENLKEVGLRNTKFDNKKISESSLKGLTKLIDINKTSFLNIDISKLINTVNSRNDEFNANKEKLVISTQEKEKLSNHIKRIQFFSESKINKVKAKLKIAYKVLENEKDIYLGELYEKALNTYDEFKDINRNDCILCGTTELGTKRKTFFHKLERKIKEYNNFKEKYNKFKTQFNDYVISSEIQEIENILFSKSKIQIKVITDFYHNKSIVSEAKFKEYDFINILKSYKLEMHNLLEKENEIIKDLIKIIPYELHTIITKLTHYKTIQESLIKIIELEKKNITIIKYVKHTEEWVQFINTVKDKFIKENNSLIKKISKDITINTQSFFQEIMNSPEIIPRIEKKDTGQKILMLLEKFYSVRDKKAATLLSESNRNALCLSIYFSCALNKSKGGFLVLDDITSSFDSGHQRNLLLLLKNKVSKIYNRKGKQIILLTHDGELEKSLKTFSSELSKKWTHYILRKESNIKIDKKEIRTDEIGAILKIKTLNGDDVGNEIRKYFEKLLLEIHKNLKIPMSYELANYRDKRMLQKLIENLRYMLKLYRNATGVIRIINTLPSESDFIDLIATERDVANIISHFESEEKSNYTPSFIIGVINRIEGFNQKFQYNCTCTEVNGSMTYYVKVNSKKVKNCKCRI